MYDRKAPHSTRQRARATPASPERKQSRLPWPIGPATIRYCAQTQDGREAPRFVHWDYHPDRARCGNTGKSFQEASKGQFDEPAMAKGSKYSVHRRLMRSGSLPASVFTKDRREERAELWIRELFLAFAGVYLTIDPRRRRGTANGLWSSTSMFYPGAQRVVG